MKFAQTLNNLREKPDHVKGRIAFWSSLVFTGFVFVIWASSLSVSLKTSNYTYDSGYASPLTAIKNSVEDVSSSSLSASAGDAWNSIKNMFTSVFGSEGYTEQAEPVTVTPGK